MIHWITPTWPAPASIKACSTTRQGLDKQIQGSAAPYQDFNLGLHVGDDAALVKAHRAYLRKTLQLIDEPYWLNQVHGNTVVKASRFTTTQVDADACYTDESQLACVVMTADCLPVLLCNEAGTWVAAAHCGWRGLVAGILPQTVAQYEGDKQHLMAWLGPAISAAHFEVGEEVYQAVVASCPEAHVIFAPSASAPCKWMADLSAFARLQLEALGIERIFGGQYCTFSEPERFYSYRRDGVTGRQATLIWMDR